MAQKFCIIGLGALSSKAFPNHSPNGIQEMWLAVLISYVKGSDIRTKYFQNCNITCSWQSPWLPYQTFIYPGICLSIPLPLSLIQLILAIAKLWKAAQTKRFQTQHLGWKELNSVGSIPLILANKKNMSSLSLLSVVTEKVKHTQAFRQPHAVFRAVRTSAWKRLPVFWYSEETWFLEC